MNARALLCTLLDRRLGREERRRREEKAALRELLARLADRQAGLEQERQQVDNEVSRGSLDRRIAVIRAQREKGERLLASGG
jgi:predicted  nucleic acid-binding Zn-ribbon protein